MAIDDRVHSIGAVRRLIHTLRERGHHTFSTGEPGVECLQRFWIDTALRGDSLDVGSIFGRSSDGRVEPVGMAAGPARIDRTALSEMREQSIEQRHIGAGSNWQM